ncbi:MAG TPA: lysophospholipid acyltransferase family protein [Chthoniobacterales bacterium]
MKPRGWQARVLSAFGYRLLMVWAGTLRFVIDDRAGVIGKPVNEARIWAMWHNRVLLFPYVIRRFVRGTWGSSLISASRDGDMLAGFVQRFGFGAARGSSSRRGASAILQLTDVLKQGGAVAITPDGPRGPRYELGGGIILLAQSSGVPVFPLNLEYSSCWRVKSWDRFILPKPFSTVRIIVGQPHRVRETATNEEFEAERLRLQSALMQLVERA